MIGRILKKTWYVRDAQGNTLAVYNGDAGNTVNWSEQHLYGSSRLGYWKPGIAKDGNLLTAWNLEGHKAYELTNHLGNVLAVVSDKAFAPDSLPTVLSLQDYYPFGMGIPGRGIIFEGSSYRYGFNGKENDNEVKGEGNQVAFEVRTYDPRLGVFLSRDPLSEKYPAQSPYAFAANSPIRFIDVLGMGPEDPPGWKVALYKAYTFLQEGRLFFPTERGQQNKKALANALMPVVLGTGNGVIRQLSLGTINRSGEDIRLDERFHDGYNRSSNAAGSVPLLLGTGGPGASTNLAGATGTQMTVTKSVDLTIKAPITLLANANGNTQVTETGSGGENNSGPKTYTHNYKYDARVRRRGVEDPVSHNFPYSFDDLILKADPIHEKNGYLIFQKAGTMNGKEGIFEIGLTKDGVINHRFF